MIQESLCQVITGQERKDDEVTSKAMTKLALRIKSNVYGDRKV